MPANLLDAGFPACRADDIKRRVEFPIDSRTRLLSHGVRHEPADQGSGFRLTDLQKYFGSVFPVTLVPLLSFHFGH